MEDNGYSSPTYKLLAFFEESRDGWRAKAVERKKRIRELEKRILELQASRRKWKEKAQARCARPTMQEEREQKRT